jgi:vitamin-K-epoxide reductase (warfarin-sensitive)
MRFVQVVIGIGLAAALYAWYVEYQNERYARMGLQYTALCDFGMFSCSKVFSSEFGHVSQFFGLPRISNAVVGTAFYLGQLALLEPFFPRLFLLSSAASCLGSLGLFYLLTVVMNDFCVVCFTIYVVNFTSCFIAYRRLRRSTERKKQK